MTDADLLRENGRLRKRVEELERERDRLEKKCTDFAEVALANAREVLTKEAEIRALKITEGKT